MRWSTLSLVLSTIALFHSGVQAHGFQQSEAIIVVPSGNRALIVPPGTQIIIITPNRFGEHPFSSRFHNGFDFPGFQSFEEHRFSPGCCHNSFEFNERRFFSPRSVFPDRFHGGGFSEQRFFYSRGPIGQGSMWNRGAMTLR